MKNNAVKFAKIIAVGVILAAIVVWLGFSFYTAHKPKEVFIQGQIEPHNIALALKSQGESRKFSSKRATLSKKMIWLIRFIALN